jgi:hypothetical protein
MLRNRSAATIAAFAMIAMLSGSASAQTIVNHPAPWFDEPGRVFFFGLDASGGRLFVNRSTAEGGEELVEVPIAGGSTQVWHTNAQREIFNRLAVSGDGKTVAFAKGTESRVYVLTSPGKAPRVVADVSPYRDPRQLVLSRDGRWVAFTAAGVEGGGPIGAVQVNLYVAATDGSAVHRITNPPLPGRYIAFALSADGATLVWVDDRDKGPIVANRDGSGTSRLSAPGARIADVFCSPDGSQVYCATIEAAAVKLRSIARAGSQWALAHEAPSGSLAVAREGSAIRLIQRPSNTSPGTCWSVNGASSRESMFTFAVPQHAGSMALSGDGQVVVWREGLKTRVWKAGP